mmetsp:Transcript_18650/g.42621  ORF Transcript_18650/g.42621 Transcript_18650/m.42621 type:complete len:200 (-) Transcript_18650:12802-13401(-)
MSLAGSSCLVFSRSTNSIRLISCFSLSGIVSEKLRRTASFCLDSCCTDRRSAVNTRPPLMTGSGRELEMLQREAARRSSSFLLATNLSACGFVSAAFLDIWSRRLVSSLLAAADSDSSFDLLSTAVISFKSLSARMLSGSNSMYLPALFFDLDACTSLSASFAPRLISSCVGSGRVLRTRSCTTFWPSRILSLWTLTKR